MKERPAQKRKERIDLSMLPQNRSENLAVQALGDETLLYDFETGKAFCLNLTSATVWELSDGTRSISEIVRRAEERLGDSVNQDIVVRALEELREHRLVAVGDLSLSRLTRRALLKGMALAAPMISVVASPSPAAATSNVCCVAPGIGEVDPLELKCGNFGVGLQDQCCHTRDRFFPDVIRYGVCQDYFDPEFPDQEGSYCITVC